VFNDPTGHDAYSTCGGNSYCMDYVSENPELIDVTASIVQEQLKKKGKNQNKNGGSDKDYENPNDYMPPDYIPLDLWIPDPEINESFDPFAGYTINEKTWSSELSFYLYGDGLLSMAQQACEIDNCNNPLMYQETNPLSGAPPDVATVFNPLASPVNSAQSQVFLSKLRADDWSTNPWNTEPNWVWALQQLNPQRLVTAKHEYFRSQYFASLSVMKDAVESVPKFGEGRGGE